MGGGVAGAFGTTLHVCGRFCIWAFYESSRAEAGCGTRLADFALAAPYVIYAADSWGCSVRLRLCEFVLFDLITCLFYCL